MSLNKREKIAYPLIGIFFLIFVIGWVDVTFGTTREVTGNTISVGIDSSSYIELTRMIATVKVHENDVAIVKLSAGTNLKVGDKLILLERDMLLTNGRRYSYVRTEN